MLTPAMGQAPDQNRVWGADTGCYKQPDNFDLDRYCAWLRSHAARRGRCLFATAPDRWGDAAATLAVAEPCFDRIRGEGYPVALVAQDGMESLPVPWSAFDVLFVGGSDPWRATVAPELVREARARGIPAHLGRVNSYSRLRDARSWGYRSADGTFVAFAPDQNVKRLAGWLDQLHRQPDLFMLT